MLDSELLIALAFVGFFLNLFNLLPIVPLDGGRAMAAIHPVFWAVGFIGLVALLIVAPNPILLLILVLGGLELWRRWQERKDPERRSTTGSSRGSASSPVSRTSALRPCLRLR